MFKASIEIAKINKAFKVKFAIIIQSENDVKQSHQNLLVNKFSYMGNEYLRVNPRPFITLDISKRVVSLLEKKGYVVKMTRTNDTYVSLQDRVTISENFKPDIFVSIHVNSSNSESPTGLETHYYKDNSLKLAKRTVACSNQDFMLLIIRQPLRFL